MSDGGTIQGKKENDLMTSPRVRSLLVMASVSSVWQSFGGEESEVRSSFDAVCCNHGHAGLKSGDGMSITCVGTTPVFSVTWPKRGSFPDHLPTAVARMHGCCE